MREAALWRRSQGEGLFWEKSMWIQIFTCKGRMQHDINPTLSSSCHSAIIGNGRDHGNRSDAAIVTIYYWSKARDISWYGPKRAFIFAPPQCRKYRFFSENFYNAADAMRPFFLHYDSCVGGVSGFGCTQHHPCINKEAQNDLMNHFTLLRKTKLDVIDKNVKA